MDNEKTMNRTAIEILAERYSQLYLNPCCEGAEETCKRIIRSGALPEEKSLNHFIGDSRDVLSVMDTPAGPVEILTLYSRKDFETFLRIMAFYCRNVCIPETQGASTLIGIINWNKIRKHKSEYLKKAETSGNAVPDWPEEFKRFTGNKQNYTDTLIVLSVGPYSQTKASIAGYTEEEWLVVSQIIRTYHECTHVVCRRLYPDQVDAIWDELVADSIGIYAACGEFRQDLAEAFLGIQNGQYVGGRLKNYIKKDIDKQELDRLAGRISGVLDQFRKLYKDMEGIPPLDMICHLESHQRVFWKTE